MVNGHQSFFHFPMTKNSFYSQSFLTGAASKNLEIEGIIATSSEYGHEPVTVEKLDASNLNVLLQVENSVNQKQLLEDISPSLKFLCEKRQR